MDLGWAKVNLVFMKSDGFTILLVAVSPFLPFSVEQVQNKKLQDHFSDTVLLAVITQP